MTKTSDSIPAGENLGYSPFRRDERDLRITEEDALLLEGEYVHGFHAAEWISITGRGLVAVIENNQGINPRGLTGQVVLIDGEEWLVRGVETRAVPDWSAGRHPFGLLVTENEQTWVL
jgi:hypothetical protein